MGRKLSLKKINLKKINVKRIQLISLMIYIISISAFQLDSFFDKIMVIGSFSIFVFSSTVLKKRIKINEQIVWIILFWLYYYLSIIWCNNRTDLLMMLKPSMQIIFLSLCLPNVIDDKNDLEKIIKYIIISMLVTSVLILIRTPQRLLGFVRVGYATGLNVNTVGIRMAIGSLLCLYFLHNKECSKKQKIFFIFCILVFIVIGFLTGSKKSVLILFAGIILYETYVSKGIKAVIKIFAVFVLVFALYRILMNNVYFQNVIGKRMTKFIETITGNAETDQSYMERQYYIERAKYLFSSHPVIGYGGNNFMSYIRNIGYHHVAYSHNNFYELLSTLGLIGFIIYYYMWVRTLFKLFKKYIQEKSNLVLIFLVIIIITIIMDYGHVCYHSDFNILLLIIAYLVTKLKIDCRESVLNETINRS